MIFFCVPSGLLPTIFGRVETNTKYEPSGAMPGEESEYSPENGATCGSDHSPFIK